MLSLKYSIRKRYKFSNGYLNTMEGEELDQNIGKWIEVDEKSNVKCEYLIIAMVIMYRKSALKCGGVK